MSEHKLPQDLEDYIARVVVAIMDAKQKDIDYDKVHELIREIVISGYLEGLRNGITEMGDVAMSIIRG